MDRSGRSNSRAAIALSALAITAFLTERAGCRRGWRQLPVAGNLWQPRAVPGAPGWSFATFNYYDSVSAGKSVEFYRGGGVQAGLQSHPDLQFLVANYALATPVLGGQANLSMMGLFGTNPVSVDGTLTGPGGRTLSGSRSDAAFGGGRI